MISSYVLKEKEKNIGDRLYNQKMMNDFGQQEGHKMIFFKKNKRNGNFSLKCL